MREHLRLSPKLAIVAAVIFLSRSGCNTQAVQHRIVAASPQSKAVTLTQTYFCKIHSHRHIKIRASERGYLEAITIKEGQSVKAGEPMFKVVPVLYQTRLDAENADAKLAQLELNYTKKLHAGKLASDNDVALVEAKLHKAQAKSQLAAAELNFAAINAPFDGIVGRLQNQQGSLVLEGETLTTLSDNSVMWVYFNVPEARYLQYLADPNLPEKDRQVELVLANGHTFPHEGKFGAIEADFNNHTGNIPFRVDFPNPERLLRHGQTGTVVIHQTLENAIVIPQRATLEVQNKRYVFVLDKENVVHQREIVIQNELEDIFVVKSGVGLDDKIVVEGIGWVRDGAKVECEVH